MNEIDSFEDEQPPAQTSGMAIASLVCGIGGLICTITALPGLILGIVAVKQIGSSNGRLTGKGMAIAGIVISSLILLMIPVMLAVMMPSFLKTRDSAFRVASSQNLRQIHMALVMAQNDSTPGGFPDDPRTLYPKYIDDIRVFKNPRNTGAPGGSSKGYVYVAGLSDENSQWVLLYEDMPLPSVGRNVLMTGGGVMFYKESEFQALLAKSLQSAREAGRNPKEIPIDPSKF